MQDNIRPSHYKINVAGQDIEVLDIMKGMSEDEYRAFCKMNTLKYVMRADKKNGLEDYKKAKFYIEEVIKIDTLSNMPIKGVETPSLMMIESD